MCSAWRHVRIYVFFFFLFRFCFTSFGWSSTAKVGTQNQMQKNYDALKQTRQRKKEKKKKKEKRKTWTTNMRWCAKQQRARLKSIYCFDNYSHSWRARPRTLHASSQPCVCRDRSSSTGDSILDVRFAFHLFVSPSFLCSQYTFL